ncbi:MAG: FAD-dependent thymidylate synthase [Bacilli bacterium]|nr:FAD-dependent thymidylate synthase [Bacilli bacterium]
MELILPKAEIWEQGNTLEDMWKHIARCTRVCYQSTPKENGETDEEFVKRVILRPDSSTGELNFDKIHGAMLEHGTVYLYEYTEYHSSRLSKYKYNKYSRCVEKYSHKEVCQSDKDYMYNYYITTNLRVIYENGWLDDLKYICTPTKHHAKRVTVSFTTNIGVSREFNRHRVNSIAEESTRYCNYSLDKFNHNIICVKPSWITEEDMNEINNEDSLIRLDALIKEYGTEFEHGWSDIDYYLFALETCNYCYNNLILKGWKPQQAREVLPLATKSQLIHTAFIDDWKHFFALRADGVSGPPHPNAKFIAEPLKEEFIKRGYIEKL